MSTKEWVKEHRKERNAYNRKWNREHPDRVRAWRLKYSKAHREQVAAVSLRYRRRLRAEVLAHYGDHCELCGSKERLSIDHINGDGAAHRKAIGRKTGEKFYVWLRREGFPKEGYRVLCVSCNAREWCRVRGRKKRCVTCPKCGFQF